MKAFVHAAAARSWTMPRWRNAGGGPSPASNTTANLPQAKIIQWQKKFRKNLKTNTSFPRCCALVEMLPNAGLTVGLFMYQTFGANIDPASEGTVGGGIAASVLNTTATAGEFADYANVSRLAAISALDNVVQNLGAEMSYRAALTASILARNVTDGLNAIDASVQIQLPAASNTSYTVNSIGQLRAAVESLAGRSVPPPEGEELFCSVMHPFTWGDVMNDNTNNSLFDMLKHTVPGQEKIQALPTTNLERSIDVLGTGLRVYLSNLVTQTANYKGTTSSALRAYVYGWDAVLRCQLKGPGDTNLGDGDWRNIECLLRENLPDSSYDPQRSIWGYASYMWHLVFSPPPDVVMRARTIDALSGIA